MAVGKGAGCVEDVPGPSMLKLKGFFKQCLYLYKSKCDSWWLPVVDRERK